MKRSFLLNALTCLIAGLIGTAVILRIGRRFVSGFVPMPAVVALAGLFLLFSLLSIFLWYRKERSNQGDSASTLALWQGIIRYFIALDLSTIGWQKIFHLQFFTPLGILDEPFSSFSGEQLTWAYFGHSYPFVCAVGGFQIVGSYLLLFRRTQLVGILVLLPVLSNIILIDYFFELSMGVLLQAILLMIGLVYLFLMEYDRLKAFFFRDESSLPQFNFGNVLRKNGMRVSVAIIPFALFAFYDFPDKFPRLTGKYEVKKLVINHRNIHLTSCQDSILTLVYIDIANDLVFEFNNQKKRMIGTYQLDESNGKIQAVWRYPANQHKDLVGTLSALDKDNRITLSGKIGNDELQVDLLKVK